MYSDKKRHEIRDGRITALYGTPPQRILKKVGNPPSILYHGTARQLVNQILTEGLQTLRRQYVHLSVE
ncbi:MULTISPECIES: RNA 2'-phosphotransferase [Paenibacillus]|uniref:RNA 2'-phosphotransferase n=1 Tax=Paenibacillus TaxID=44249 RepID=UPI001BCF0A1A